MILVRGLDQLPAACRAGAVAIGNFDGVHRGHAQILQRVRAMAQQVGGPAVAFTFDPPPAQLLRPDQAPALLTWTERKAELLAGLGVDVVIVYPTTAEFLNLDARAFFDHILCQQLAARGMVEGTNFFFGHARKGNVELLGAFCREIGIPLEVVQPVLVDGEAVSSSRVRRVLAAGRIDQARAMLTAPYRIRGTVVHGAGRGRTLGYPTANLAQPDTLLPGEGIYAGRTPLDGRWWPAAISVGPNPTFGEGALKVEVFLIGYEGDLYDRVMEVEFLARLRNVERFPTVEALLAQMNEDVAETQRIAKEASRD